MTIEHGVSPDDARIFNEDEFNKYIKRCVKRDTPITITINKLFKEKYPIVEKEVFIDYLDSLNDELFRNLSYLFQAFNNNTNIDSKLITVNYKWDDSDITLIEMICVKFNNQLDNLNTSILLPFEYWLLDLIFNYINRECYITATFDEILTVLDR